MVFKALKSNKNPKKFDISKILKMSILLQKLI